MANEKTPAIGAPAPIPEKKSGSATFWLIGIGLFVIYCIIKASSDATAPQLPQTTEIAQPPVQHIVKREAEVQVGTEWYNPNVQMLSCNIEAYPLDQNIRWEQKALYRDGNYYTVEMPSYNDCIKSNITMRVTFTNIVTIINGVPFTNTVDGVYCRIKPGQGVDHSTFRVKTSAARY